MIEDVLVVDATVHAFNFQRRNYRQPFVAQVTKGLYHWIFDQLHPYDDARYKLSLEEFENSFELQPELMESVLFRESDIDIGVYHGVPMYGFYGDGSSPISVAERIRAKYPHRMFIYGGLSPWEPDAVGKLERLVDEHNVIGIKMYPVDVVDGELRQVRLTDDRMFAILECARRKGLKVVAIHKALPLGPVTVDRYGVDDIAPAAQAFPGLCFEIVHGGFAFREETADLLGRFGNVCVNLEAAPLYAVNFSDRFAQMLAPLLATGAHERIFFSSGATGAHPQPCLEAFWRLEMPRGYPRLTPEMKRGILGENFARQHGWNAEALKAACANDDLGQRKQRAEPWAVVRRSRGSATAGASMAS
jgi:predicted TIM-barrel fold metal-dependent hydrolase